MHITKECSSVINTTIERILAEHNVKTGHEKYKGSAFDEHTSERILVVAKKEK